MELKRNLHLVFGMIVFVAVLAFVSSFGDGSPDPQSILSPPGAGGILGTAPDGRDLFRTLCAAAARGVLWSSLATFLTMLMGTAVGIFAAEGRDRFVDRSQSIVGAVLDSIGPFVICACVISVVPGIGLTGVVGLVAIVSWPTIAVVVRKEILTTKTKGYYEAALSLGLGPAQLFIRHVLPNVVDRIVPLGFAMCAAFLGLFAALDFIGVGVRSQSQLGAMIYDSMGYLDAAPWYFWSSTIAFGAVIFFLAVVSAWLRRVLSKNSMHP